MQTPFTSGGAVSGALHLHPELFVRDLHATRCVNAIQAAAAQAFEEILRDAGVPVTISGKDYQAMVSPSGLAVDLEEAGFTQDGALTVRLLMAELPIPQPAHNDTILIGGERHKIDEINRKPGADTIEYRVASR